MSEFVVIKEPNKKARIVEVNGEVDYELLSSTVGGYITQAIMGWEDEYYPLDVTVFANDEGLLMGLPVNVNNGTQTLVGNLIATHTDEVGNSHGFDAETAKRIKVDFDSMATDDIGVPSTMLVFF